MANTTITNLPLAIALTGTEQMPAVQSTTTVRLTVSQIATYTSSTMAAPVVTIGGTVSGGTPGNGLYVSSSGTLADFPYGAGIFNAIKIAAGSNGSPVLFNGAGGTPTSLTLTLGSISISGATNGYLLYNNNGSLGAVSPTAASISIGSLISGGTSGQGLYVNDANTQLAQFAYGTGVRTALGVNVGSAGAPVLFNGAGGLPSSIDLTNGTNLPISAGTTGNLPVTRLNSGTGATASTYWRGDGTWSAVSGGSGTVTSVAQTFTGGIVSVGGSPITTSGTLALTVAGTSGGIPYFSSTSAWASSAALTLNGVVYGGGAGASPVSTAAGTTGQVLIATTSNAPSWGQVPLGTGVTGTLPVANGGTGQSTALTQYGVIYGSSATAMGNTAAGTTGQVLLATTSAAPSWGQVSLTAGVTGVLPIANGGTNLSSTPANGALDIGNGTGFTRTTLTAGTNITITNGAGSISIAASGGSGTVNSGTANQLAYYAATGTAVSGNQYANISGGALTLGTQSSATAGSLVLANTNAGAFPTTIKSSASATAAWSLTLPVSAGTSAYVLSTDGTGVTSWVADGGLISVTAFPSSGTWTKPTTGFGANSRVYIQAWGGGGSGGKGAGGSGGGGGGYNEGWFYLSQFPSSTYSVTVGTGAAAVTAVSTNGTTGGTTYIGAAATTYIAAYGGGGSTSSFTSGGGGGQLSAATTNNAGLPGKPLLGAVTTVCISYFPPGNGGTPTQTYGFDGFYHGGGGSSSGVAGNSVWGGGGGGCGYNATAGGTSVFGGNGGAGVIAGPGIAGTVPGGGGGGTFSAVAGSATQSGKGGDGQMIITVFPN